MKPNLTQNPTTSTSPWGKAPIISIAALMATPRQGALEAPRPPGQEAPPRSHNCGMFGTLLDSQKDNLGNLGSKTNAKTGLDSCLSSKSNNNHRFAEKKCQLFGRSFSMRDSPVVSQRGELRGGWFCKISISKRNNSTCKLQNITWQMENPPFEDVQYFLLKMGIFQSVIRSSSGVSSDRTAVHLFLPASQKALKLSFASARRGSPMQEALR